MVLHSTCPLCTSGRISLFLSSVDHLVSMERFGIWKCRECGFVFTNEYPDEKDMGKYYESHDYVSHDDRAEGFINKVYLIARDFMLRQKTGMVIKAGIGNKGKLLDIGCGTGYFAGAMKKSGWEVTGIEPSPKAREFAKEKFEIEVLGPEKIKDLPSASYGCITMWHVLEHLHDPFGYAAESARLLSIGGAFIVALPNCNSSDARHYGDYWAAYDAPRHLWHFSPETFRIFADKTGFIIDRIRPLPLDTFYISILSEKNKGTRSHFVTGLLRGLLFSPGSLFSKNKSSSLIYFLRKK